MAGKYKYLTFEDRQKIEVWHACGDRPLEMAARLGVHTATIYNELKLVCWKIAALDPIIKNCNGFRVVFVVGFRYKVEHFPDRKPAAFIMCASGYVDFGIFILQFISGNRGESWRGGSCRGRGLWLLRRRRDNGSRGDIGPCWFRRRGDRGICKRQAFRFDCGRRFLFPQSEKDQHSGKRKAANAGSYVAFGKKDYCRGQTERRTG